MKKVLLSIFLFLVATGLGAVIWLDRQFEEPGAKWVQSIAGELNAKSVLAIFAHPDDEQLVTGLLIRAVQDDEAITRIITSTKGEAGTPLPQISRLGDLGTIRHAEVLKNGYVLGVSEQKVWDYPDGKLSQQNFEEYVDRLQNMMSVWEPDLIVTFWPQSGFTNHSDHKVAGLAATEAVRRLREVNPNRAPKAIAYILAPKRMMGRFGGETGKIVVTNQPEPTHAMPGEGWAKIRGWHMHSSQRGYVKKVYGMPPSIIHRLYDKEHYYVLEF